MPDDFDRPKTDAEDFQYLKLEVLPNSSLHGLTSAKVETIDRTVSSMTPRFDRKFIPPLAGCYLSIMLGMASPIYWPSWISEVSYLGQSFLYLISGIFYMVGALVHKKTKIRRLISICITTQIISMFLSSYYTTFFYLFLIINFISGEILQIACLITAWEYFPK